MQIEIDFDVFKALTVRRRNEGHSYNEVLRELLGLQPHESRTDSPALSPPDSGRMKFQSRRLTLPDGTQLKATYKGKTYRAKIEGGRWLDESGGEHKSPSAAASAITKTNVNGLRFWLGKRPSDNDWLSLEMIALIG